MSIAAPGPQAGLRARGVLAVTPLAFLSSLVQAGAGTPVLDPVVITATRTPQPMSDVLADLSVVDRAHIRRSGAASMAEVLAGLPGIEFARAGGPGASTSVYIRGGETRHTAVYIDGVRVDSQSTGGAAWEQIPLDAIDRIEVLRGPAAAVYGSDAVAGVVQLFTRRGLGAAQPHASISAGSLGTVQAQAGVSGSTEPWDYTLSVSHGRSDGFNARTTATANPDDDGWRRQGLQARVGHQPAPQHRIEAALLATRLRAQYDGSLTADDVAHHGLRTGSLEWQGRWGDQAATRLLLGESAATYETRPTFYRTETRLRNLVLQHEQPVGRHQVPVLLERREDRLHNPATTSSAALDGRRTQHGVSLGWHGHYGRHGLQAHLRHDVDSEFGDQPTGSLAWGWHFAPRWRATAAAATSFRAPTLYQRFSEHGVASLAPESGRNAELGLRWSRPGRELTFHAWHHRVSHLISFGPAGPCRSTRGCYENIGRARLAGVTLAGHLAAGPLALRGSLDWHDPRNADTGTVLARRARRLASFGAGMDWAGWRFDAGLQAAGARFDNAANTQRLGGFALVHVHAGTQLVPGLRFEAGIDNLGDRRHELARTYNTAGRTVQLNLHWAMP